MKRLSREYHDNKVRGMLTRSYNPAFISRDEERGILCNNPEFNKAFQKLVVDGLRSPYNTSDIKAMLQELQDDFQATSMYRWNILRHGRKGAFMQYLLGLPPILSLPYSYRDETDFLVELTGEEKIRDLDDDQIDFFYWAHVEYAVHTLLKEHGMKDMYSLDITD